MYVHIKKPATAINFIPIDLDTCEIIDYCFWADDEKGEYGIYVRDKEGNIELEWGNPKYRHLPTEKWKSFENLKYGGLIVKRRNKKGNIKIIDLRLSLIKQINDIEICKRIIEKDKKRKKPFLLENK